MNKNNEMNEANEISEINLLLWCVGLYICLSGEYLSEHIIINFVIIR